jgi:hypothetical protein
MYRNLPLQDPPKFSQIWIFGWKICIPSGSPDRGQPVAFFYRENKYVDQFDFSFRESAESDTYVQFWRVIGEMRLKQCLREK